MELTYNRIEFNHPVEFCAFVQERLIGRIGFFENRPVDVPDHLMVIWTDSFAEMLPQAALVFNRQKADLGYAIDMDAAQDLADLWYDKDIGDITIACDTLPVTGERDVCVAVAMFQSLNGWLGHWAYAAGDLAEQIIRLNTLPTDLYAGDLTEQIFRFIYKSWYEYKRSDIWPVHAAHNWVDETESQNIWIGYDHH